MAQFLAAIILVGFGVLGMCVTILLKKNGQFPDTEVGHNEEMRKLGISCVNDNEKQLIGGTHDPFSCGTSSCSNCGHVVEENKK